MNLVSNYLEKNILSYTVNINGIQSRMSLKLRIKVVAFFLGHPVFYNEIQQRSRLVLNNQRKKKNLFLMVYLDAQWKTYSNVV